MRFISTTFAIATLVPALSGGQRAQSGSLAAEPLNSYIACSYSHGLSVVSISRFPGQGVRHRTVETAKGKREVSVIDGYRLLLSQGEPSNFANIKIEKSDPRQYPSDKDAAIKNLEYAMQLAPPHIKPVWDHFSHKGFDVYAVTDTSMGGNGPNGMYLLFRDSAQTIVTIYLLSQQPEHRRYRTIDAHDAMVDKMIEDLTTCANSPPPPAIPGSLPPLRTPDELDRFINKYYMQPLPERIPEAMIMLTSSGVLQIPEAVGVISGFFSEVFLANPSRLAEWQPVIGRQPGLAKSVLDSALSWSKLGGVLQLVGRTPQMNDFYWGAFFASGNPMYVKKLLELAPLAEEQNDFVVWTIGSTAKWSLARNARQHALLRSILEAEKRTADKRTQGLIDEVLRRDPERIRREMFDFRDRQIRAGKWE